VSLTSKHSSSQYQAGLAAAIQEKVAEQNKTTGGTKNNWQTGVRKLSFMQRRNSISNNKNGTFAQP